MPAGKSAQRLAPDLVLHPGQHLRVRQHHQGVQSSFALIALQLPYCNPVSAHIQAALLCALQSQFTCVRNIDDPQYTAAQVVFESVIFLFLVHPYDVGDGIILANSTEYLIVRFGQPLLPLLSSTIFAAVLHTLGHPNGQAAGRRTFLVETGDLLSAASVWDDVWHK